VARRTFVNLDRRWLWSASAEGEEDRAVLQLLLAARRTRLLHGVEELLVTRRCCEILHRPGLQGLHSDRDVGSGLLTIEMAGSLPGFPRG